MTDPADPVDVDDPGAWQPATRAVRSGRRFDDTSLAPVLWPSTSYTLASADASAKAARSYHPAKFYGRNGNPTVIAFEEAIASLEGAEAALALGSGMAAVTSVVMALCSPGDHVVAQDRTFSVTNQLFTMLCPRFGIDVTFVDATDAAAVAAAVQPGRTQLVFVESPANPALALVDIAAVKAELRGPLLVVDGTFAPPPVQHALALGADLVVHAATKGIAGHNDATLGVVAGPADVVQVVWGHNLIAGAVASPFDAWNALRGVRTLVTRIRTQTETALALASFLEGHPAVSGVLYPGLPSHPQHDLANKQMASGGTLLTFELAGGLGAGKSFVESVRIAQLAASLGGPETLVTHPPTTTAATLLPSERAAMGITDGMIRVSVGLEDPRDLLADFTQALAPLA
jgi:cystathionine beta-lyase/cystathionine gamma-synthase